MTATYAEPHSNALGSRASGELFPIYVAMLLWVGLGLRDGRVRALFQPRA
jgi:hypothetical protein